MSKIFITSDTHFDHVNCITFSPRPFKNVEEMNETIIQNWNDTVDKNDTIWHLGDFCFGERSNITQKRCIEIIDRLNGNIKFIMGNHDRKADFPSLKHPRFELMPKDWPYGSHTYAIHTISTKWGKVLLSHYPIGTWTRKIHLYGHIHLVDGKNNFKGVKQSLNVNLEYHAYKPILLKKAIEMANDYEM